MTPFDPAALLAMLRAFYPAVSVAALRLARAERPEYFAGGDLFGTHGEKFRLPDGRVFDLIFDVDGVSGGPAWQVIEPGPGEDGSLWPLERGPLDALDAAVVVPPLMVAAFEDIVSEHVAELVAHERVIELRAGELAAAGDAGGAEGVYDDSAGAAESALYQHLRGIEELDPSGVAVTTQELTHTITDARGEYVEPEVSPPPEIVEDVQPGPPPEQEPIGGEPRPSLE